jgi:hypothetical protein
MCPDGLQRVAHAYLNGAPLQKKNNNNNQEFWTVSNRPEIGKNCLENVPDGFFWTP